MKYILTIILWSSLFMFTNAQTAQEIVLRHFEATGGIDNWNKLNSIELQGEAIIGIGEVIPIHIEHKRPYYKRVSYIIEGDEKLNEGFDGEKAYTYDDVDGGYKMVPDYLPDAFETDLLNYERKGFEVKYIGKEKIGKENTYKIQLIKNDIIDTYWFNTSDYQIIQELNQIEKVKYSDFKVFDGLSFATKVTAKPFGGEEYVIIFSAIEPNAAINDKRFKFN